MKTSDGEGVNCGLIGAGRRVGEVVELFHTQSMHFIEIPSNVTSPIRVGRIPLLRFVGLGFLTTLVHLVVSAILIGGWFGYGMAAGGFNGHKYIGPSNFFLGLFNVWNAGYVYVWNPLKDHVLPAYPPYQEPPKVGSAPDAYVKYHPYEMNTVHIHRIKTTWDVIAFVSWASICGLSITFIYLRRHYPPQTPKVV